MILTPLGSKSYSVGGEVEQIQTEIMTNGPVEAAFTVYADFPTYKTGKHSKYYKYSKRFRYTKWYYLYVLKNHQMIKLYGW